MAPLHSSSMLFGALTAYLYFFYPAFSVSRVLPVSHDGHGGRPSGFRVLLHHVDSGRNLTRFEKIHRGIHRSRHRLQRLTSMAAATSPLGLGSGSGSDSGGGAGVQTQVHSGTGEFLMRLSIGTPAKPFTAIMDTGSDLIWTQCKPCSRCYKQPTPIFDPRKSSSFSHLPCSTPLCAALPASSCGADGCEYTYTYGDSSSTQGAMGSEIFSFRGGDGKTPKKGDGFSVSGVAFGCGEDNEGDGFDQASGIVGLGRGPLSLVSQLVEPRFSYCLTRMGDPHPSSLLMGSLAGPKYPTSKPITIGLLQNPAQQSFYYLPIEGISVGDTRLDIDRSTFALEEDGSGGMIIDSGTTITYLEQSAYDVVRDAFVSQTRLQIDNSRAGGLDLCFTLPESKSRSQGDLEVPKLVLHFSGGSDLELPSNNYMIADSDVGVACLAMGASSGMSVFGNIQQQNMLILYDLKNETMSFTPTNCNHME